MLRNSTQYVCLSGLAAAFLLCGAAAARTRVPDAQPDVLVCVRDDVFMSGGAVAARAEKTATAMFTAIGVRVAWTVEGEDGGGAAGVVLHLHIADRAQPGVRERAMAYAYPYAGEAKLITIIWDRVRAAERTVPGLAAALLAHVMAHEITHVLQGVSRHSATGVMKPAWTLTDCQAMYRKPLPFTPEDARLVDLGLVRLRGIARIVPDVH
ncbi:MAG: hypothetical protein NTW28_12985 [Candidatus Solibacter sp.]|nr:hypothetical protein [Candidatus Solibacter sp.]